METKANFALIGAFTIAVIVGGFMLVLFLSGLGRVEENKVYQVLFTGSVSGLTRGAVVLFDGIRVGEVTQIDFVPNQPGRVSAFIKVESRIPVKSDTKARLELQGLTGGSAIALTGGAPDAPPLAERDGKPAVLIADQGQLQSLLDNVASISAKADAVLGKADQLIAVNGPSITDTLHNIDLFSKALGDNSAGIGDALGGVAELGRKIGPLANRLQKLSDDTDKLIVAVDPTQVKRAVSGITAFTDALGDSKGPAQSLLNDAAAAAKRLNETSVRLDSAVASVDALVKSVDPKKVGAVMDGAAAIGQKMGPLAERVQKLADDADRVIGAVDAGQVRRVVDNVASFSAALGDSKGPAQALLTDAAALAKRLNETSARLDTALADADGILKAVDPKRVASVMESVDAFGQKAAPFADHLQKLTDDADKVVSGIDSGKIKQVVDNVASFSTTLGDPKGPGQSLLTDAAALAKRLNESSVHLNAALEDIDSLVKAFDTSKVAVLMDGVGGVGETLKANKGNLDHMLSNASELAAKLNKSADKVDSLLTSAQGFLGSGDMKGPFSEVGEAAKSVRRLADDLNARTKDITAGLTRFSGSGLREYEALAIDGRRTVNDLDRVLRGFEKNPTQLLFGAKPSLPEFNGGN